MTYRTGRYKMPEMPTLNPFGHAKRLLAIEQTIDLMQTELETSASRLSEETARVSRYQEELRDFKEMASHEITLRREAEETLTQYESVFRQVQDTLSVPTETGTSFDLIEPAIRSLRERCQALEEKQKILDDKLEAITYPSFVATRTEDKMQHVLDRLSLLDMENEDLRQADAAHRTVLQTLEQRKSQRLSMRRLPGSRLEPASSLPFENKAH